MDLFMVFFLFTFHFFWLYKYKAVADAGILALVSMICFWLVTLVITTACLLDHL